MDESGVDHCVGGCCSCFQAFEVEEVAFVRCAAKLCDFVGGGIVAGEADDFVAVGDEIFGYCRADEARDAGDEDTHIDVVRVVMLLCEAAVLYECADCVTLDVNGSPTQWNSCYVTSWLSFSNGSRWCTIPTVLRVFTIHRPMDWTTQWMCQLVKHEVPASANLHSYTSAEGCNNY